MEDLKLEARQSVGERVGMTRDMSSRDYEIIDHRMPGNSTQKRHDGL